MTKLKVVIGFSVYNKYYKPPKMEAKLNKETGTYRILGYGRYSIKYKGYCSSNDEDNSNPLYVKFKVNDILEVKEITVHHNLKSFAYVTYNNETHEVPLDVLNFCTEKL